MDDVLVSVVIPTFNRASVLKRAITSVVKQSYTSWELIIVDDGSVDNTEKVVSSLNQNKKIQYYKIENSGVSAARNFGVRKAKANWIAFLDSDDEWLPEKLALQIKQVEKSKVKIIHGNEIWIRNGNRVNQKKVHQKFGGRIFKECLSLCLISPSAVMLTRDLYEQYNGFDEQFIVCEDYDLWLKITAEQEIGFIEDPIINKYGGHSDQLSRRFFAMDYWRVKSLWQLDKSKLFSNEKEELLIVLKRKCEILLAGYKKHNNYKNYEEIKNILDWSIQNFNCVSNN